MPVDDLGFRQAATAVERLRTYRGEVFQLDAHLDRWQHTVDEIGIDGLPLRQALKVLVGELIGRNEPFSETVGDFGITMLATPGGSQSPSPTFVMHLNTIDHAAVLRRRQNGQPLVVTGVAQPSSKSWPRSIKVRSRLHYFLADKIARQHDADAMGVLVDEDGCVTETSVANLAVVEGGKIFTPPDDRVLGGITQRVIEQLARQASLDWQRDTINSERLAAADEVLLMGTDGGLWFASQVDGQSVGDGQPGTTYTRLLAEFDQQIHRLTSEGV
ncbi:MAG: aminotransferase class IV [Pirellulales bacterium]|nr:aminotransferase class IV [Pirellulales bacterium]